MLLSMIETMNNLELTQFLLILTFLLRGQLLLEREEGLMTDEWWADVEICESWRYAIDDIPIEIEIKIANSVFPSNIFDNSIR